MAFVDSIIPSPQSSDATSSSSSSLEATAARSPSKPGSIVRNFNLSISKSDIPSILDTLSRAFERDPVAVYFSRAPSYNLALSRAQFRLILRGLPRATHFYATASLTGALLAMQYPQQQLSTPRLLWLGQWRLFLHGIPPAKWCDVVTSENFLEKRCATYMKEHHLGRMLYIYALAVDPEWQNQGLGSTLLRHLTDLADSEGQHVYLEATAEANKRLYERHGFREASPEWKKNPRAPTMWFMARKPHTQ